VFDLPGSNDALEKGKGVRSYYYHYYFMVITIIILKKVKGKIYENPL
jgi:hypothetical protein